MIRKNVSLVLSVTLLSLTGFATHKDQKKMGQTAKGGFLVTVNYNRTIEELVKAGRYHWQNSDITSQNFPSSRKGKAQVLIQLVHFDRDITSDEVLKALDKQGLRPVTLPELLAFGAKYPDKQCAFPIVALGSVWRVSGVGRRVAYLWRGAGSRGLGLYWLGDGWGAHSRFAAVRNSA